MSYVTNTALSGTVSSLLKIIENLDNEVGAELSGLNAKMSQLFTRMGRVEDTNSQQWDAIGKRALSDDVWNKFKSLDQKIASLDAKNASQDASISNIWSSVETAHATNAAQTGTNSLLGGLGIGLSTTALIALGVGALLLLRK
jgi:hypothetical protein